MDPILSQLNPVRLIDPFQPKVHLNVRFDLRNIDDVEVKEKYQVVISNRFAALENLDESLDINTAWESIRENIKSSEKT
jgi:hypothetical protein